MVGMVGMVDEVGRRSNQWLSLPDCMFQGESDIASGGQFRSRKPPIDSLQYVKSMRFLVPNATLAWRSIVRTNPNQKAEKFVNAISTQYF
jgi:hypothetical protein